MSADDGGEQAVADGQHHRDEAFVVADRVHERTARDGLGVALSRIGHEVVAEDAGELAGVCGAR